MADDAVLSDLSAAISQIESGGKYDVVGPAAPSGDKPYGKYQVMGNNVPSWSEEAGLGKLTPQQFLQNPDAQEKVFRTRIGKYLDTHNGSVEDAASMWHSGVPLAQARAQRRRDIIGTSTDSYVAHVMKNMQRAKPTAVAAAAPVGETEAPPDSSAPAEPAPSPTTPMPNPSQVLGDPKFWRLPSTEVRLGVMKKIDPNFGNLSPDAQTGVLKRFQPAGFQEPTPAGEVNYGADPRFNTQLSPDEEPRFQQWKAQYAPRDSGEDYDLRGAFKAGLTPGANGHFDDRFKKPNHPTFSTFSQYAKFAPEKAGTWNGDQYVPAGQQAPSSPGPVNFLRGAYNQIESHESALDAGGRSINSAFGLPENHWTGMWTARVGKNAVDAVKDFFEGASTLGYSKTTGEALGKVLQMLHPLAVPGETATDMLWKMANDSGFAASSPNLSALLTVAAGVGAGMAVPVPGAGPAAEMPLQGSTKIIGAASKEAEAAATAATEAASAAERGTAWAGAQKGVSEAATQQAATEAQTAQRVAQAAESQAAPSIEATQRAQTVLTPAEHPAAFTGGAVRSALEGKLAKLRDQTGAIYDTAAANAEASGRTLDPSEYQNLSQHLADVRQKLGTMPEAAERAAANLENKINTGQRVTAADLNNYKAAVDTTFPGKMKSGTEVRGMLRSLFTDDDREWAQVADTLWRDEIAGRGMTATSLGSIVKLIKKSDPAAVVEKLFGTGGSDAQGAMAQAVMRHLKDTPYEGPLREAVFARMMKPDAEGKIDPAGLVKAYDALNPAFRKAFSNPGADAFFRIERAAQEAAERTADVAKGAAKRVGAVAKEGAAATKETEAVAAEARSTAEKAAAASDTAKQTLEEAKTAPNTLARMTAAGLELTLIGIPLELIGEQLGIRGAGAYAASAGAGARMMMRGARQGASALIPSSDLAKFLANSKTANILARALKTPANSAVVPTILQQLKDAEPVQKAAQSPQGQQKLDQARQDLEGMTNAPQ